MPAVCMDILYRC